MCSCRNFKEKNFPHISIYDPKFNVMIVKKQMRFLVKESQSITEHSANKSLNVSIESSYKLR